MARRLTSSAGAGFDDDPFSAVDALRRIPA
jgi:hypothetical protein